MMVLLIFFSFGFPLALIWAIHSGFKKNRRALVAASDRQREAILYTTELGRQQLVIEQVAERRIERLWRIFGTIGAVAAVGLTLWAVYSHPNSSADPVASPTARTLVSGDPNGVQFLEVIDHEKGVVHHGIKYPDGTIDWQSDTKGK
jgi:hypothetical protein